MPNSKLKLYCHFGEHDVVEDAKPLEALVARVKPDVVCIEGAFSTDAFATEVEEDFNAGKLRKYAGYVSAQVEAVKRHSPKAKFYLPERMPEVMAKGLRNAQAISEQWRTRSIDLFFTNRPLDALEAYSNFATLWAKTHAEREVTVLRPAISNLYARILARYPELAGKPRLKVAFAYGAGHSGLYATARKSGFMQLSKTNNPVYFQPEGIFIRRFIARKPIFANDAEVPQMVVATLVNGYARGGLGVEASNAAAFARNFSKQVTLDKFSDLSSAIHRHLRSGSDELEALHSAFQENNLPLPRSREEVHTFLRKKCVRILAK